MSLDLVQRALVSAVSTSLGTIPTGYDNEAFAPPSNTKWAAVHFLPNTPSVETLGAEGEDMVDGIVQVDLNYPVGIGSSAARADFESLRVDFPAGSRPTHSGQEAIVTRCGRSASRMVDGWYRISVTISWYALIPR